MIPMMEFRRPSKAATMKAFIDPQLGCASRIHVRAGKRKELVTIPCGQCKRCRVLKQEVAVGRILMESKLHEYSTIFTLTLDPAQVETDGVIHPQWFESEHWRDEIHKLMDRLRKTYLGGDNKRRKFFYVAEKGEQFGRPHAHLIVFGTHAGLCPPKQIRGLREKYWPFGAVTIDSVRPTGARYCAGYVANGDKEKNVITKGKSHLLGRAYLDQYHIEQTQGPAVCGAKYKKFQNTWAKRNTLGHHEREHTFEELERKFRRQLPDEPPKPKWDKRSRVWPDYHPSQDGFELILHFVEVDFRTFPLGRAEQQDYGLKNSPDHVNVVSEIDRGNGCGDRAEREKIFEAEQHREFLTTLGKKPKLEVEVGGFRYKIPWPK